MRAKRSKVSVQEFLSRIRDWAAAQPDIQAVLLVGSYARGAARPDSDVDLVILTGAPDRYLDPAAFPAAAGPAERWIKEDWGAVTSIRVWYQDGLEVEYGIAAPDWAAAPFDAGTRRVLADGMRIVFGREAVYNNLRAEALRESRR